MRWRVSAIYRFDDLFDLFFRGSYFVLADNRLVASQPPSIVRRRIDPDETHRLQEWKDQESMPRHVHVTCPNCQRPDIRIRPEYVGRKVQCKHCNHIFRARLPAAAQDTVTVAENGEAARRSDLVETEVRADRRPELPARGVGKPDEPVEGGASGLQDERTRRRVVEDARDSQIRSLVEAAGAAREQIAALRTEIQAHREREAASAVNQKVAEELIRERDSIAAERDRLRVDRDRHQGEAQTLRAELEARSDEAARLGTLAAELEAARAERGRLEAEGQQAAKEAGESRRRLDELERARAKAIAEHEEARRSWEAERRELLERQEPLRAELEARSAEAARLGTLAAELEAVRAERDRLEAERRQAVNEAGELRRRQEELRTECDGLQARLDQGLSAHQDAEQTLQRERDRLAAALDLARQENQAAVGRGDGLEEQLRALGAERDRLLQVRESESQEHGQTLEALRQEREAARRQAEEERAVISDEAERIRAAHADLRRQADALGTERDRLDRELDEARSLLAGRVRQGEEREERARELQKALEEERRERAAEGQQHARELDALRQERDAERKRSGEREEARQRAEETGETFRKEAEHLRAEVVVARRLADELRGERDRMKTEHEVAAGRLGLERDKLAAVLDQAQQKGQAEASRAEALDTQLRALREEFDRLRQKREADTQEQHRRLEGAQQEVLTVRAERDAERGRGAAGEAARADLQRRLAEALREHRAALKRVDQLEAEVQVQDVRKREAGPGRVEGPGEPSVSPANTASAAATQGNAGSPAQPVEELARQLQLAQEANERLRAFLAVFGMPQQKIGNDAE